MTEDFCEVCVDGACLKVKLIMHLHDWQFTRL